MQDGVTVNYSAVMLAPGQSLMITITGGRRGYAFAKGAEFFGYGNRTNTTVSSPSGGYSTTTTIELL